MNYFRLIFKNLFRNKRRTTLTLLGVVISFLLFVAIFTLLESFNRYLKRESAQVNLFFRPVYMSNFIDGQLPEAFLHTLAKIPLIQYLTPYKVYLGTGRSEELNIFALGVYPDQIAHIRNIRGVTPIQLDHFNLEKKAGLVGQELLDKNHWKIGDDVILKGIRGLKDLPIHIVGAMDPSSDLPDIVLVRYDYLKDTLNDGGLFSIAVLRVSSPYQVAWVNDVIKERFENSIIPVEAITEKGFIESVLSEFASISAAIKVIAWITLVATLFVVGNTMSMSIRERSVEQGVMRTLGFSKGRVFGLYLSESVILALVGGVVGGFIGCFIFQKFDIVLPGSQGMQGLLIRPYWGLLKQVFVLALLMGLMSGTPPAFFALRKKITDTLRFVA